MTRSGRVRRRGYACDRRGLFVSPRVRAVLCEARNPIETTFQWHEPILWLATFFGGALLGGVVGAAIAKRAAARA